jgi:cysteinyl-tRNA synthetase
MNKASAEKAETFLNRINDLLGIVRNHYGELKVAAPKPTIDEAIVNAKVAERSAAKKEKDFARADAIRSELESMGVELRDTPQGPVWALKSVGLG